MVKVRWVGAEVVVPRQTLYMCTCMCTPVHSISLYCVYTPKCSATITPGAGSVLLPLYYTHVYKSTLYKISVHVLVMRCLTKKRSNYYRDESIVVGPTVPSIDQTALCHGHGVQCEDQC